MLIVGISGKKRSGKDEAADTILINIGFGMRIAFADAMKREVLEALSDPHHQYWQLRHGTAESFFERVHKTDTCWLWTGGLTEKGYGKLYTPQRDNYRAHRFMWEVILGNPPEPMLMHHCDVRNCVNPLHLQPCTAQSNSSDMVNKGRSANGESHSQSTISDHTVELVREMFSRGKSQASICSELTMASSTVSRIVTGATRVKPTNKNTLAKNLLDDFTENWLSADHKSKFRNLLQHYGTEFRRELCGNRNYWIDQVAKTIARCAGEVSQLVRYTVITDVRFQNEYEFIRSNNGILIRVNSNRCNMEDQHPSEVELDSAKFDYTIENNGTLDEFRINIGRIAKMVIAKRL